MIAAIREESVMRLEVSTFGLRSTAKGYDLMLPAFSERGLHPFRSEDPRNPHLRQAPQRETAGQAPAPLHEVRA